MPLLVTASVILDFKTCPAYYHFRRILKKILGRGTASPQIPPLQGGEPLPISYPSVPSGLRSLRLWHSVPTFKLLPTPLAGIVSNVAGPTVTPRTTKTTPAEVSFAVFENVRAINPLDSCFAARLPTPETCNNNPRPLFRAGIISSPAVDHASSTARDLVCRPRA